MLLNVLNFLIMAAMFLWMIKKARFKSTRRMAFIPLGCAMMELLSAGMLSFGKFPLLTLALFVLRAAILLCCVGALRRDAALAEKRRARRLSDFHVAPSPSPAAQNRCA